jgi:pSer/pThr/pTyr-binding forkhead associated (FHA) protein
VDEDITHHPETHHPYLPGAEAHLPVLKGIEGSLNEKRFQLSESTLIGRDPACDILIDEQEVSRQHAVIQSKSGRYLLSDLDSTNGVYVNNIKIKSAVLKQGDLIQVGSCVFQFFWS